MDPNEFLRLANALASRLQTYQKLEREIENAGSRLIDHDPDTFERRAVASILEDVYTGAEGICQLIAKSLDRKQPSGKHWHKELLEQMSADVPDIRPPVLRRITVECLNDYLGFRHVARNIYGAELDWHLLTELLAKSLKTIDLFAEDMGQFVAFLEMIAADLSAITTESQDE